MVDFGNTIAARSDQTNGDDLIQGPMTIKITKVTANASSPQQPRSLHYEDDKGKPYKPNLSMRRVLVHAWGKNGEQYVGRSLTIYRDPAVRFGPDEVGGIKISHMSHIERDFTMALTVTRGNKKPHSVKVLKVDAVRTMTGAPSDPIVKKTIENYGIAADEEQFCKLENQRSELWPTLNAEQRTALKSASDAARARLTPATKADEQPTDNDGVL